MAKMFKQLFSCTLIFTLLLLLMVACGGTDDNDAFDSYQSPPPQGPDQDNTPPPPDNDLGTAPSIDDTCIVWKPVSEGDHNLVILLTGNYGSPEVFILDENGNTVEQGRYVGSTNGGRATYRFSRPGHGYSYECYLQVGGTKYKVLRPDIRHSC
jgi:hypothetical protein